MHRIPDPTGSIHDALQIENAARNLVVSEPLRLWRALTTNRSNRVFLIQSLTRFSVRNVNKEKATANSSPSLPYGEHKIALMAAGVKSPALLGNLGLSF